VHNHNTSHYAEIAQGPVAYDPYGNFGEPEVEKSSFDIRKLLIALRANLWIIGVIVCAALGLALVVTMLQTPRYTAEATLQINNQPAQVLGSDQEAGQSDVASPLETERFLQTQLDILSSRAMGERVAQRLRLYGNAKFYAGMGVRTPDADTDQRKVREFTLKVLANAVKVDLPRSSRLATIDFTSIDPALSAQLANAWTDEFIQANLQRRYDSSTYAREFISGQLAEAKAKLETSERDLNAYARQAGLIRARDLATTPDVAGASSGSVTTASLLQVNAAANQAEAARIAAEQRWRSVSQGDALSAPEVLSNSAVNQLLSDRARVEADLQRERTKHLEDHPSVQQAKAQLAAINQQIGQVAKSIRASVKQQYDSAVQSENDLKRQVAVLKGSSLAEQDRSVQYNLLAREADTNRTLYDGLLQRYKELNAAAGISASNIAIIDTAEAPTLPSSPNLAMNLALALIGGLVIAGVVVLIRFHFDDAVRVPEDVEGKLGMTLLGVIPTAQEPTPSVAMADPKSAMSEAYNSLRTSLLYSTSQGLPRTLLVTSSQPSEGKSTTSLAIARGLARLGRKVVLLDTDMRRPALHAVFGVDNEHGMSSLLTAQDTLAEVLRPTEDANLDLVTSGPIPPSPTELLSTGRLVQLLDELKGRYDVVILDSPPVLGLADAPMMSAIVDGVVMVVQSSRGRRGSLRASLRRLRAMQPNVLGAVLTMFDASKVGNRYSEYYGYNYYSYSTDATNGS
jgi:capsular exopolysaccharide synthesis family protein